MKILALEFSTFRRSVALADSHGICLELCEEGARSSRALLMVDQALAHAAWRREDVNCVAVGLGPGSYTGIRTALALAQGWQLGQAVAMVGISSVECMAAVLAGTTFRGPITLAVDAQRAEYYVAQCEIGAGQWRVLNPLSLISRADLLAMSQAGNIVGGPELSKVLPAARQVYPTAGKLAEMARYSAWQTDGSNLEPIYLRATTFVKAPPPRLIPD